MNRKLQEISLLYPIRRLHGVFQQDRKESTPRGRSEQSLECSTAPPYFRSVGIAALELSLPVLTRNHYSWLWSAQFVHGMLTSYARNMCNGSASFYSH